MFNMMLTIAVTFCVLFSMAFVMRKWPRRGRMGINLNAVFCPECGDQMPAVRRPLNLRQVMWGGWTCPCCRCEMDKYGTLLVPGPNSAKQRARF